MRRDERPSGFHCIYSISFYFMGKKQTLSFAFQISSSRLEISEKLQLRGVIVLISGSSLVWIQTTEQNDAFWEISAAEEHPAQRIWHWQTAISIAERALIHVCL